jgi:hypothetical protein
MGALTRERTMKLTITTTLNRLRAANGASKTPTPTIFNASGHHVGYVSYNGRAWLGNRIGKTEGNIFGYDACP